ncbi:acetoacetate decarboxylase [Acidianus sulfidivorans JP7]|uniref:Acetoacetate decarboxylase n=1 Tax=Acidianus sulfidivorans JP7 TaxID=619593 RepID=A0A2U9ILP7_9CREN|nr:acetoacetate decarboxylase family protein [Acidianus sulfidivorans]AWR96941.1 acetoacetate decarboxylase [Acidianus sulfidivorans JP7]
MQNDFTLPLTKSGRSQLVYPPPWHYAVTYISAHVKFDKDSTKELLPSFLTSDGEGWIYIADFISTSDYNWDFMYLDPDLVQYMEGAIGLKVQFEGKNYLYFPFMWVDKDWALVRGLLDGYPKKFAKISMTKFHSLLPKYSKPEKDSIIGGYVVRYGGVIFRLQLQLKEKTELLPIRDFGPVLNIRKFPSRGEGEDEIYEVTSRIRDQSDYGEIWKGDAKIELGGYVNDEVNVLNIEEVRNGYFYTAYFRVSETRLLKKLVLRKERINSL